MNMKPVRMILAALAFGLVLRGPGAHGQIPGQNPDWPCAARLVVTLEPGSYWNGPVPLHTGWRDDETVSALVTDIVDRDTPESDAMGKLGAYMATIPPDKRAAALPALFSAIVDQTNDERSILITRIEKLGHRQRGMGDTIGKLSNQVDATAESDARKPDLVGERDFDIRVFQETQHTMRYACEAPANMERRLGAFARVLQAALTGK